MKTTPLCTLIAFALGLATATGASAQDTPTPRQEKELENARVALDKATQRYAELAARYGDGNRTIRIERSALRKPVIGVVLAPDDRAGVRIAGVTPDSAAAAAGLKSGDRIISIDGRRIDAKVATARVEQSRELLAALDAKTAVTLGYDRDGKVGTVSLTPRVADRLLVIPGGTTFDGDVQIFTGKDGAMEVESDRVRIEAVKAAATARRATDVRLRSVDERARRSAEIAAAVAPGVRREVIHLGSDCKGDDCRLPVLAEAFRWNGLNLAALNPQLGRYFGANEGVLVLSIGKDLEGLQPGDVMRRISGKAVTSPREVMELLRAQPAGGKVAVDYLRDRKSGSVQLHVPDALPFTMPRAMTFVGGDDKVVMFPAAGAGTHSYVMIDQDGKRREWEGDAGDTPPAWVHSLPAEAGRTDRRVQVIVEDRDGKPATGGNASKPR